MKSSDLIYQAFTLIPVEWGRLQKQAVGLRKAGLFPDGRAGDELAHVTCVQAGHLIRIMAVNANPFADDFPQIIDDHRKLVSKDNSFFILDFAEILYNSCLPSQKGIVHHISFSLDRPRVVIVFEEMESGIDSEEGKRIQFEKVYGDGEIRPSERWCIIKQKALMDLSMWLTDSNHVGDDNDKALKFYQHINA